MGSSGGSSTPQNIVTTQNKDPWSGAQPYLGQVLSQAQSLYGNGEGYRPWQGSTQADMNPDLSQALQLQSNLSRLYLLGTPGVLAGQGLANYVIGSHGMTPGIQGAVSGLGQVGNIYGGIANLPGGLNQNQYNTLSGLDTANSLYGNMYGQAEGTENPYLQNILGAQGRKIADQVNSNMSGAGRYGSGAHTNVLSRNLAEAADPILAQDYQARQQQKLAALGGMQSVAGQQLGAFQQGIGNQMAGAQGLGQTQQAIADLYGQGLNRAGQYSQLVPSLDQAQYMPLDKLMGVGQYLTDRAQAGLQGQIQQYNTQQAYPWEQLARYSAIANGAGGLGGSQVTSAPNVNAPVGGLQGALGGALAGGIAGTSIFGPGVGSLAGAGVGGLLGYLR